MRDIREGLSFLMLYNVIRLHSTGCFTDKPDGSKRHAHWIRKTPTCMNRDAGSYQLRKKEEVHVATLLNICGYPSWTMDNVKRDIVQKSWKSKTKKGTDQRGKHKGFVVVPYLKVPRHRHS